MKRSLRTNTTGKKKLRPSHESTVVVDANVPSVDVVKTKKQKGAVGR